MQLHRPQDTDVVEYVKSLCGKGKGQICWWDDTHEVRVRLKSLALMFSLMRIRDGAGKRPCVEETTLLVKASIVLVVVSVECPQFEVDYTPFVHS